MPGEFENAYVACLSALQKGVSGQRPAHTPRINMTNRISALVIGGSIGGLSAAHALLRAGCRVTVLERAPSVSGNSLGAVCKNTGFPLLLVLRTNHSAALQP